MKKFEEILESLHPLERQVLKHIKDNQTASSIAHASEMKEIEVKFKLKMRRHLPHMSRTS